MNILDCIGNTPLINLNFLLNGKTGISLYAKAEMRNPGGSIKDRPVKRMLLNAIAAGTLSEGKIILDSSSGNAGIAYSMIGNALGYKVAIVVPGNASIERKQRIRAHGAQLIETDALEGYDHAMRKAHELYENNPDAYFLCDQYSNEQNWLAHYEETAEELVHQVNSAITHFIAGVGTGGSITGIGRKLKEKFPGVKIIAVKPESWPGIEGLKPLESPEDIVPKIFDRSIVDEWVRVSADEAKGCCRRLSKYGWFVGHSSGAYVAACEKVLQNISKGTIVTVFNDLGERYFSAGLWG